MYQFGKKKLRAFKILFNSSPNGVEKSSVKGGSKLMSVTGVFKVAPYDAFVKTMTYIVSPILTIFAIVVAVASKVWIFPLMVFLFHIYPYFFSSVREYVIKADRLVINRPVGSFSLPYSQIIAAKVVNSVNIGYKVFANAGLFGYYGLFYSKDDNDRVRIYATNLKQLVQIKTGDGKKIYISPAEPEKFVEALKQYLNQHFQGGENP